MVALSLISIVDDDISVRESLPDLLREFGYVTEAFSSAEKFLASPCLGRTACLIVDVSMPGMSGPDLQQELRRRDDKTPYHLHHRPKRCDDSRTCTAGRRCLLSLEALY
jgi:FixJ family two-component response regulator